jgi:hypothetical protein
MEMGAGNAGVDEMEAIRLGELATIVSQTPMLTAAQPAAATTMNERMEAPPNRAHNTLLSFAVLKKIAMLTFWNF